jgi:hypothetical protein
MRSMISGSMAALESSVTPSAQTALEDDLFGGADAGEIEADLGAAEAGGGEVGVAGLFMQRGAEVLKGADVKVHGAGADAAAAE